MTTFPFSVRVAAPQDIQQDRFGPLSELAGNWVGSGFNLISRPGNDVGLPFVLQVNATTETLTFEPIGAVIPNRGSVQGDIDLFAMTYRQEVSDATSLDLLHAERGMWLNVPASTDPSQPSTVVRLSTIPHGDSLLAQGSGVTHLNKGPLLQSVSPVPIDTQTGKPIADFPPPFQPPNTVTGPLPPGFDITNPNAALVTAIQGQTFLQTVVLEVSTQATPPPKVNLPGPFGGGILNIPFVTTNANVVSLDAFFWIEIVAPPAGAPPGTPPFLQLQYTQTVVLNFLNINWPHISVATLKKH